MNTSPYSLDLREKVVSYVKSGKSQASASRVFKIHRNTVSNWIWREKKEGHYKAKVRLGKKRRVDHESIISYALSNPDSLLKEIGNHYGICSWHVSKILHKAGIKSKKKNLAIENQKSQIE